MSLWSMLLLFLAAPTITLPARDIEPRDVLAVELAVSGVALGPGDSLTVTCTISNIASDPVRFYPVLQLTLDPDSGLVPVDSVEAQVRTVALRSTPVAESVPLAPHGDSNASGGGPWTELQRGESVSLLCVLRAIDLDLPSLPTEVVFESRLRLSNFSFPFLSGVVGQQIPLGRTTVWVH